MKARFEKYTLHFKQPAGTSRGTPRTKDTWFLYVDKDGKTGVGECGMFKGLSYDDRPNYEEKLQWLCNHIHLPEEELREALRPYPAIWTGYEIAMRSVNSDTPFQLWNTPFSVGEQAIPINGLVWMGNEEFMLEQIKVKLAAGFSVIKIKVGAIDFEKELQLLQFLRDRYSASEITIRLDANGAFTPQEAEEKLAKLAKFDIHSIEQPIRQGQRDAMRELCSKNIIPIALDEELIGITGSAEKGIVLDEIKPQYIILKPTLVGGFSGSEEWIAAAQTNNIPWWATSALESNVGLNAIAQWVSSYEPLLPQGLGTGSLFTNNINSPLEVHEGSLWSNKSLAWDTNQLNF